MQRGSVDILKNLRRARSRLDKCIKFMVANERREKALGKKRAEAFRYQQEKLKCAGTPSTKTPQQENSENNLLEQNAQI